MVLAALRRAIEHFFHVRNRPEENFFRACFSLPLNNFTAFSQHTRVPKKFFAARAFQRFDSTACLRTICVSQSAREL
jgi:hypothetical protein